jgi:DNA (cytosine-5)-methyltransferase 1
MMKILNLYAGTGGNRRLWPEQHHVIAVENNTKIAEIYKNEFPNDEVIRCDAHQFLLDFYKEVDFIWSSPPCPTHSQVNTFLNPQGIIRYPDMSLWQEIIFLKHFCKVPYCVENVKSYYEPLITPQKAGRHYFWANFIIPSKKIAEAQIGRFGPTKRGRTDEKDELKRNEVNSQLGLDIFNAAFSKKQEILCQPPKPQS